MSARERVAKHSSKAANRRIRQEIRKRIDYYASNPDRIEQRLRELDKEWDIERTLEANASTLSLFGLAMGFAANRKWFLLPLAVQAFFFQHALQGWCPPLPILRRYKFRTVEEIELERTALKALRGDFRQITDRVNANEEPNGQAVWQAVTQ